MKKKKQEEMAEKILNLIIDVTTWEKTRERSLVVTKLEEAIQWLHSDECKHGGAQ